MLEMVLTVVLTPLYVLLSCHRCSLGLAALLSLKLCFAEHTVDVSNL